MPKFPSLFSAALVGVLGASVSLVAQYTMTVNKDRLINAQNEPQNWLMMNGDYGSTRYSKLTQINRDNVKNLRMVWALALGGMQDVGQNGPENEVNPLIDNGFMYTTDGWGTIYKIDARDPNRGQVRVGDRSRREARGQRAAHARHRALGRPGHRQPSRRPRDRHQPRQRRDRLGQEGRRRRTSSAARNDSSRRRSSPTARCIVAERRRRRRSTRGWVAALDVKTGNELWRWYVVPKPGDPGSETWKDKHNAWKTGGGGIWQTGSYDPAHASSTSSAPAIPIPHLRSAVPSRRQPLHQLRRRAERRHRQAGLVLPVHAERFVGLRRGRRPHAVRHDDRRRARKVVGHFARNGFFYSLDRTNGKFIKGEQYVNDLNWTKGINPKTGKPVEYNPKLDVQIYNPEARALRGDGRKRTCPTWHGGIAHQPMAYNPVKNIAYGVGTEGCFSQNGAAVGVPVDERRHRQQEEREAHVQQRPLLRLA